MRATMAETLTTIMLGIMMMMMMIMILVATVGAQLDSLTKNSLNQTRYPMIPVTGISVAAPVGLCD